jgi:hypothetical protein
MSEIIALPGSEDYKKVVCDIDMSMKADYLDVTSSIEAYRYRHRLSQSFFQLALSASRVSLYFEEHTPDRKLANASMPRAKAFMRGIFLAEMINDQLFHEEYHDTAFKWLTHELKKIAIISPEYAGLQPREIITRQFEETSSMFLTNLEDPTRKDINRWSSELAALPYTDDVVLGMGVQLGAGFSYHSHKIQQAEIIREGL